jgi:hypothetical protein
LNLLPGYAWNSGKHWSEEKKTFASSVLVHHFEYKGYDIWGLTVKLIFRLLEVGLGYVPDFPVHHPDSPTWMAHTLEYSGEELEFESELFSHSEQRYYHASLMAKNYRENTLRICT